MKTKTTSLEISKKLMGLGVKLESDFVWCMQLPFDKEYLEDLTMMVKYEPSLIGMDFSMYKDYPSFYAYTAEEIGGMLPSELRKDLYLNMVKCDGWWECSYDNEQGEARELEEGDTMVDAMAEMLIWLIEEKLINVNQINN